MNLNDLSYLSALGMKSVSITLFSLYFYNALKRQCVTTESSFINCNNSFDPNHDKHSSFTIANNNNNNNETFIFQLSSSIPQCMLTCQEQQVLSRLNLYIPYLSCIFSILQTNNECPFIPHTQEEVIL